MRFIYFTKLLKGRTAEQLADFLHAAGMEGADLAVRPGYPVDPQNVATELPKLVKHFHKEDLKVPLVSAPVDFTDPTTPTARRVFEACGANGVEAIKIGYFHYSDGDFEQALGDARRRLAGFTELARKTGVRACCHTHSGSNLGSNCAGMRLLLADLDPHHVGAFVDTGHQSVGGAPFRLGLAMIAPWLSLLAIKDFAWSKTASGWQKTVVPAGEGIGDWNEFAKAVHDRRYDGLISIHGEYEAANLADRLEKAKKELAFVRGVLKGK